MRLRIAIAYAVLWVFAAAMSIRAAYLLWELDTWKPFALIGAVLAIVWSANEVDECNRYRAPRILEAGRANTGEESKCD